jgi:hypothetical protein
MKIASISATNFKGSSFSHKLGAVTIFHGPNGAGKSSVIEALRLGMLGYDPRVPKKKADIFRAFSSGDSMKVEVEFDTGKSNVVDLIQKKGAVSGEIAINEEFPNYLFDLSEYWGKSKADRAQLLMSLCVTPENASVLKGLESQIAATELAISNDTSRRKMLEQGIAAKVSADIQIKVEEPPKDIAAQINAAKAQLQTAQDHLRNFSGERSALIEAERSMEAMAKAQEKATKEAPEPTCEHCGKQVQFLKHLAATSYAESIHEAYTRLGCMRPLAEIDASVKEWEDYTNLVRSHIVGMERRQQDWIRHCGSRSEDEKMQSELDLIGPRLEKSREDLKAQFEKRKKLLSDSVAPLLEKANAFIRPTLDMELCIEEGEIGFMAERFIPFVSLSGAQEIMAIAGLQLALSQDTKCRVVVMDELGRLHETTKKKLVDTIHELLKLGTIEQFVGCDVSPKGYGTLSKKCFVEVARA